MSVVRGLFVGSLRRSQKTPSKVCKNSRLELGRPTAAGAIDRVYDSLLKQSPWTEPQNVALLTIM